MGSGMHRPAGPAGSRRGVRAVRLAAIGLLAGGLLACATTLPPPAAGPSPAAALVLRVTLHGVRMGATIRFGTHGYNDSGLGLAMYAGEPARVRLRDPATNHLYEPTRFVNGYCFFMNIPPGAYRFDAVELDSDTTVWFPKRVPALRAPGGGAWYAGTWRLTFDTPEDRLERLSTEDEQRDREEVARLLAGYGKGRWVLQPDAGAPGGAGAPQAAP